MIRTSRITHSKENRERQIQLFKKNNIQERIMAKT